MASDRERSEKFEKGLKTRREVLGDDYVDRSVNAATDFNWPLQKLVTEYCCVKRHPKLTPDRRPILTPLGVERCGERPTGWSWPGLRSPVGRVG